MTTPKSVNYLSNKLLLEEIRLSKNSYCWYETPQDALYKFIIDEPTLAESLAKIERVIAKSRQEYLLQTGDQMDATGIVFRVMTSDHIPADAMKSITKRNKARATRELEEDYSVDDEDDDVNAGVNFPPFQHYRYNSRDKLVCGGKSHWLDGKFSSTHGMATKKLALAWLQLVDRYSTKWNWRGYSWIDEMKSSAIIQLTQVGLRFNEARSDNPFAYLTAVVNNAFIRQLKKEKQQSDIKNELREMAGLNGSFERQVGDVSER